MAVILGPPAGRSFIFLRRPPIDGPRPRSRIGSVTILLFAPTLSFLSFNCFPVSALSGVHESSNLQEVSAVEQRIHAPVATALRPLQSTATQNNLSKASWGPNVGQQIPLAVPPNVRNVPLSNALIRLRGDWTDLLSSWSDPRSEICISLINVALTGAQKESRRSAAVHEYPAAPADGLTYDLRSLKTAPSSESVPKDGTVVKSTSSTEPVTGRVEPGKGTTPEASAVEIEPSEFPVDCQESFKGFIFPTDNNPGTIKTTVVCGPDRLLSDKESLVFLLPVALLEFIYLNFDVLGEAKLFNSTRLVESRWLSEVEKSTVFPAPPVTGMLPSAEIGTRLFKKNGIESQLEKPGRQSGIYSEPLQSDIRICFRASPKNSPIEAGKALFHPAPSPRTPSEPSQISIKVRKFINPGWEWESSIEGTHFTRFNFFSLKFMGGDSSNPCGGFGDKDSYMTTSLRHISRPDSGGGERAAFRFEEDFRTSFHPSGSGNGRQPLFNVCLYSDLNEGKGTRVNIVDFVIDPKDATLLVAFVIFVLLCILICGVTISCYAFKHRRLRKRLRRLRLVQQRDDIERRLMIELGIGESDDADENDAGRR